MVRLSSEPAMGAAAQGLYCCGACEMLCRIRSESQTPGCQARCPRCNAVLHRRKPASLQRTWAYVIAALILYIPANLWPFMHTQSLLKVQSDTILSGVVYLWSSGSWPLALLVFFASIVVPGLKIVSLLLLAASVQLRWRWRPRQRTRLYRLVDFVGRWSMLDIYVVALMVALLQVPGFAAAQAGPGAMAFGAVVVLTMLASMSFDPRLIWDSVQRWPSVANNDS